MARVTPEQFQQKHNRNLKNALVDMQQGVQNVREAPGVAAAAKQQKMLQRLTEKVNDGTWAARTKAVSVQDWQAAMLDKGIPRVSGGIDAAAAKVTSFASQLLPYVDQVVAKVGKMPDLTIEDSINRSATAIREMSKFRKK